ncbi:hypothetical protein EV284_6397 [Streptomyces sp. BK022]|uniref:hypothetical protein n=1 Tax=Streptomyces sp. BK022 TaxID=2512123 RepID=UPI00102A4283|nr:hypothetical protein [Streptomyces sp. BK022]RZU28231.1 hypothetical protein EV284_6397 [Streptomyces sp. BK022]
MPVSLDKTPPPLPEDMDRAPAYRVELRKITGEYFVLADTGCRWTPAHPDLTVDLLAVERAASHPVERDLQSLDFQLQTLDVPGTALVIVYAISAAQAAGLARRILTDG